MKIGGEIIFQSWPLLTPFLHCAMVRTYHTCDRPHIGIPNSPSIQHCSKPTPGAEPKTESIAGKDLDPAECDRRPGEGEVWHRTNWPPRSSHCCGCSCHRWKIWNRNQIRSALMILYLTGMNYFDLTVPCHSHITTLQPCDKAIFYVTDLPMPQPWKWRCRLQVANSHLLCKTSRGNVWQMTADEYVTNVKRWHAANLSAM